MEKEVLIIDESQGSDGLEHFLETKGCSPIVVGDVDAGLEEIKKSENLKIVLLNVEYSGEKGLEALEKIKKEEPDVIVIVIRAGVNTARKAMPKGAATALSKRVEMEYIHSVLDEEFRRLSIRSEQFLLPEVEMPKNEEEVVIIGDTPPMFELQREIGRAASNEIPILIEGETGTGKGLVAHMIHEESKRAKKPFILVDCGTLSGEVLTNELFGHVKEAYTDAKSDRLGKFEAADGGTLFLDEVGNMTQELQKRLLTVLQIGQITPLGETQPRTVDVRVVSATNQNLRQMVGQEKFRQDLFYRLRASKISVPPLRERIEDIPLLVAYFLQRIEKKRMEEERMAEEREGNTKNRRQIYGVSQNVMKLFQAYDWPGNVRELENCLERAATNSQGDVILQRDLSLPLRRFSAAQGLDRSVPQVQFSETPEAPIYRNLLDLPVSVFCQMLVDGEAHITCHQITEWWEEFSDEGRARAHKAKHEIDNWLVEWHTSWLTFPKLSERIRRVIDQAVRVLSKLRDEEGSKFIENVKPITIKGKTLEGSLAAVLHEVVKRHGDDREKAAKELGISIKNLNSRLNGNGETDIPASRSIELIPDNVIKNLLIEPIKLFVLEPFSHSEWRDKAREDQIGIIYLDLKVLSERLGGDHGCIYFGGMTFSQIERNIYRRAPYIYPDHAEAIEALNVDSRTFYRYWPEEKEFPTAHTLLVG